MRINSITPVWKEYLNDFINIVSLDPSSANKRLVCHELYQYFFFLSMASGSGQFIDKECDSNMTPAEADSILISARDVDLRCPPWLNISFDFGVAKIKADCSTYGIEGGAILQGSYDHDFKTGASTLAIGVGVKAKFFDVFGSAGVKQMVYLTIDNNNSFSDFGLKGSAGISAGGNPLPIDVLGETIKIGGTLSGVDAGYTLGINSGFNSSVKGTGVLSGLINLK
ncbi:hypothetical protein BH11BAC3_BH11BAC3_11780 [soil metagenome]